MYGRTSAYRWHQTPDHFTNKYDKPDKSDLGERQLGLMRAKITVLYTYVRRRRAVVSPFDRKPAEQGDDPASDIKPYPNENGTIHGQHLVYVDER